MRVEADEPGLLGSILERGVQSVVAEGLAPIAQPQGSGVGESVGPAQSHVAVDGAPGTGPERHRASLATLTPPNHGDPVPKVDVLDRHADHLAGSSACFEHE